MGIVSVWISVHASRDLVGVSRDTCFGAFANIYVLQLQSSGFVTYKPIEAIVWSIVSSPAWSNLRCHISNEDSIFLMAASDRPGCQLSL
jgi:hypothetical protein